ncbi:MAG: hypothetical protein PUB18_01490 [bacterium]|nr:hypothetical protein [bacterium]
MKINFQTNDYLLTWNLLYGASISSKVHAFKQKLWITYKKQYTGCQKDKDEMLHDIKNYIPDDDILYNLIFETEIFEVLKSETEKHRNALLKIWDENKKEIQKNLKEILKWSLKEEYNVLVLHPKMDSILTSKTAVSIGWGFQKDLENPIKTITNIIFILLNNELRNFELEYKEIVQAVLELAIHNELYTRISGTSNYLQGEKTLTFLKRQIYPYWLMYLGCEKEDMPHYMMRDKIAFDIDDYIIEEELKKVNLQEFIKFCIKNQKHIVRINHLEII